MKRARRIAILGCGPAGIFAAQAAVNAGHRVHIYSNKRRSEMFGAQYLHEPIPGLSEEKDFTLIEYVLQGTVEGYRRKVYGERSRVAVSPEKFLGTHPAWDIRAAYYAGWHKFFDAIEDTDIDPDWILSTKLHKDYDLVISSIPAPKICYAPGSHYFTGTSVFAIGDAPERGVFCPVEVASNSVVCNGEPSPGWYRASNVFGYKTAEWPGETRPPLKQVSTITKPISTNCDCYTMPGAMPVKFLPVGRYGRWDKDELSHMAYGRVAKALEEL